MIKGAKCLVVGNTIPIGILKEDINVLYIAGDFVPLDPLVRQITSKTPSNEFPDGSLDYIYCPESQEKVWRPKLKEGGEIVLDPEIKIVKKVVKKPVKKKKKK